MGADVNTSSREFFTEAYRTGFVPWEAAAAGGAADEVAYLDREDTAHPSAQRRALDIGCGRGAHAALLAQRHWRVSGSTSFPRPSRRRASGTARRGSSSSSAMRQT